MRKSHGEIKPAQPEQLNRPEQPMEKQMEVYRILMRADKDGKKAGTICEVNEREAFDLEALGYARIIEKKIILISARSMERQTITLANQDVETNALEGGEKR